MKMRLASDEREIAGQPAASTKPGGDDSIAYSEEREGRRIEFRSSLMKARAAMARMESGEAAQRSLREVSAGLKSGAARMMQELANAL
jgi:hypothetical protein